MQNGKEKPLRLLIVDDSTEHAEAIVSTLRNSGLMVRALRPKSAAELTVALNRHPLDMILAAHSKTLPQNILGKQIAASGKDISLVLLTDSVDEKIMLEAASNGVNAIALRKHATHLLRIVKEELADLQARRDLRRLETQMRETERRCDALISSSREPIAYIHEGMHIRANEAYLEMFGYRSFEDIEGISVLDMVAPPHVEKFKQLLKSLGKGEPPPPQYKVDMRGQDSNIFSATMEFTPALYEGEACLQVIIRIEEMDPELAREVEELRQRDHTTGLFNRPTMIRHLEEAVARAGRNENQYGFLLIEVDHYRKLLGDIGLDLADPLVAAIGHFLKDVIGAEAVIGRHGESSFAVIAAGDYSRTTQLSEKIRAAFTNHVFSVGSRSATLTISIGGAQIGEKIASVAQVLGHASESLHTSVEMGGNSVRIFDPGAMDRIEKERIEGWIVRMRQALKGEGFQLLFRPASNLMGESIQLYDASLRLEHNGEMVSPPPFLSIAQENNLLVPINRWVVTNAIKVLGQRKRAGHTTHIMVRITPESLSDPELLSLIEDTLRAERVAGNQLWLQIPESRVSTHLRNAQQFLSSVSAQGCLFGLEQFGAGLDSLRLFSHFKPAFLKLDRSFTSEPAQTREQMPKIQEITEHAQEAGIITIAEFVADAGTMGLLFTAGIDYVQGDFVGPATTKMDFEFS